MKFIDLHVDTLLHVRRNKNESLLKNTASVDFERMKKGGCAAEFFAIFLLPQERLSQMEPPVNDAQFIDEMLAVFERDVAACDDVRFARSFADFEANEAAGKMSAFLTFEDGRAIDGSLDNLKAWSKRGISLITLTWSGANCFGTSCYEDAATPLTAFGREAVAAMNDLRMIIDVSHLSDGGFWDVAKISKKPFVASHSNARSLSPHPRNLTDEMLKALGDAGGIAGINFCANFLNEDTKDNYSTIAAMVRHAAHIKNIGGAGCVALGSDLDGIRSELEIGCISEMPRLWDALQKAGFTVSEIEAAAYGNAKRLMKEVL